MTSKGVKKLMQKLIDFYPAIYPRYMEPAELTALLDNLGEAFKGYQDADVFEAFQKAMKTSGQYPPTPGTVTEILDKLGKGPEGKKNTKPETFVKDEDGFEYSWNGAEWIVTKRPPVRLTPEGEARMREIRERAEGDHQISMEDMS